jgi:ring-1,2-phenylacetyl-CoA epoxidase subunit PaaD
LSCFTFSISLPTLIDSAQIWSWLAEVTDPEIPVLNVVEMGIVRKVEQTADGTWEIDITPTYSGCPAMKTIEEDITEVLVEKNIHPFRVRTVISPPWTTDWLTEEARVKLNEYGIAPPQKGSADKALLMGRLKNVQCPRCHSEHTTMISQFGSTACKSLYRCEDCKEPFDYFKCI